MKEKEKLIEVKNLKKYFSIGKGKVLVLKYHLHIPFHFFYRYSSLNPRMTVLEIISEGIGNHEAHLNTKEKEAKVYHLLESVGLKKVMLSVIHMSLAEDKDNVLE